MSRVDTAIVNWLDLSQREGGQSNKLIRTAAGVLYYFFSDASSEDLFYVKSTNYGLTWTPSVTVTTGIQCDSIAVWFDQWTPGDSGTRIHIAYIDLTLDDVFYKELQTSTDTLGSAITVFAGTTATSATSCLTITKTIAGRIVIVYDIDGGTEKGAAKGDAIPVTSFAAIADPVEAAADYFIAVPGVETDTNDFLLFYWDRSATEITIKVYDDSLNSWSETAAVATGMTSLSTGTASPQWSAAVRLSDSHSVLAAWSAADTLNADLRIFDVGLSSSVTEKTRAVVDSTDDQACCGIGIDATNDHLYAFYFGKTDGSETCYTALNCYYTVSTDGGATWGAETLLSTITRPLTMLMVCPSFSSGEFYAAYGGTHLSNLQMSVSAYYAAGGGGLAANPLRGFV